MNDEYETGDVSIKDVAKLAKVSIATVSRMINKKGYVSNLTRIQVEKAIKDLGYQHNTLARILVTKRSQLIAVIVDIIANPFYPQFALGVEEAAEKNGFSVILCNMERNPEKEK